MTADRALGLAIGLSFCVHAGILAMGGRSSGQIPDAPRLLEARLERALAPPEPARPAPPKAAQPVEPQRQVRTKTHEPVAAPAAPVARMVAEATPERSAPAVAPGIQAAAPVATSVVAPPAPVAAPVNASPSSSFSPPSFGASYLDNPKPGYPLMARRRGLEGVVRLDVRVSIDGRPVSVKVRESAGFEALDEAAVSAVSHWRFVPARRGSEAVEASVIVPVRFRLSGEEAG